MTGFMLIGYLLNGQTLEGIWGYQTYPKSKEIRVYGDKITNAKMTGRTGTLKVELYATKRPYSGGTIRGYCLFSEQFAPLHAGYHYKKINTFKRFTAPTGSYYITILLLEYNKGYKIVDWISISSVARF